MNNTDGSYSLLDILEKLKSKFHNLSIPNLSAVVRILRHKNLITSNKVGNAYQYTEQDLLVITESYKKGNYQLDPNYVNEHYFSFTEAATLLKNTPYTKKVILNMHDKSNSTGLIMYKNVLRIPKKLVFELQQSGDISNYISAAELAHQMNIDVSQVKWRIRTGFFKDAKKIAGVHYVSLKEAEKWKHDITSPITDYTNTDALLAIEDYFNEISERIPAHSHSLFHTWITSKISNSHGRAETLKIIASLGIELYKVLLDHLTDNVEIYDLEQSKIEALVSLDVNKRLKKEIILFYNYSLTATFASPDKKFRIERPSRKKKMQDDLNKAKKIYHPKIYQKHYSYVQDLETHTINGVKKRTYANMWLFVIMHLTNSWRANDIIFQMPHISIENIGITNFEWFETNKLNTTQAQIIANEVYLYFHNKLANKNLAILRFYLDPTLLLCFATAMVICELHSRFPPKSLRIHRKELLGTFISGKKNEFIFSSGYRTHKNFFGNEHELKKFSSLVMNRSTMVYFFQNTVEGPSADTAVALELTKITRSHLENNTTAIYVESSNQDGTINRVSINLFSRGHFGWLYNYIINLVLNGNSKFHSLEERSAQIKNLRSEFPPLHIEGWSEFFLKQKIKENPAIITLSKLTEEQLTELLYKIFKNKMPSKHKEGQCLINPKCESPSRSTCFGCNFFIPQEFILIEAVSELKKRVHLLRDATLEAAIIRESKFINTILLLLSEANEYLGDEKLNSFITKSQLSELVHKISDKLLLNEE